MRIQLEKKKLSIISQLYPKLVSQNSVTSRQIEEVTTSDMTGYTETIDKSPSLLEPTKDYMTSHTKPPGSEEVIYHDHAETLIPPLTTVSPLDHGFSGAEDHLEVSYELLSESNNNTESEPTKYVLPNRLTQGQPAKKHEPTVHAKGKYPVAILYQLIGCLSHMNLLCIKYPMYLLLIKCRKL